MKYLIDPGSLTGKGGGGPNCRNKGGECIIDCKLCSSLCPDHNVPLYGIEPV